MQYCEFLSGNMMNTPGSLTNTNLDNYQKGFLAFVRLIGCAYFKKNAQAFTHETPVSLFKTCISEELSATDHHKQWLSIIREKIWSRTDHEENIPASWSALQLHWKRSCWVKQLWAFY